MTIYNQIAFNKRRSFFIVLFFILFVSFIFYLVGQFFDHGRLYFWFGLLFAFLSSFFSYFFSDRIILFSLRAKPASKKDYFHFYTVVENLVIAAGLSMPKLYVINDPSPNAFATGRNPKNSVICVTTGLLNLLDRSELEGVVAHELSHIKNYDILLASLVAVLVGSVAILSDWLLRSTFWFGSPSQREEREKNPLLSLMAVVVLIIAPLIATLIQLALSRQREFLADADGVLLTRYPAALARALEKISQTNIPLRNAASGTAHLFITNPFKKIKTSSSWLVNLFNTHPPVEERIKILSSM